MPDPILLPVASSSAFLSSQSLPPFPIHAYSLPPLLSPSPSLAAPRPKRPHRIIPSLLQSPTSLRAYDLSLPSPFPPPSLPASTSSLARAQIHILDIAYTTYLGLAKERQRRVFVKSLAAHVGCQTNVAKERFGQLGREKARKEKERKGVEDRERDEWERLRRHIGKRREWEDEESQRANAIGLDSTQQETYIVQGACSSIRRDESLSLPSDQPALLFFSPCFLCDTPCFTDASPLSSFSLIVLCPTCSYVPTPPPLLPSSVRFPPVHEPIPTPFQTRRILPFPPRTSSPRRRAPSVSESPRSESYASSDSASSPSSPDRTPPRTPPPTARALRTLARDAKTQQSSPLLPTSPKSRATTHTNIVAKPSISSTSAPHPRPLLKTQRGKGKEKKGTINARRSAVQSTHAITRPAPTRAKGPRTREKEGATKGKGKGQGREKEKKEKKENIDSPPDPAAEGGNKRKRHQPARTTAASSTRANKKPRSSSPRPSSPPFPPIPSSSPSSIPHPPHPHSHPLPLPLSPPFHPAIFTPYLIDCSSPPPSNLPPPLLPPKPNVKPESELLAKEDQIGAGGGRQKEKERDEAVAEDLISFGDDEGEERREGQMQEEGSALRSGYVNVESGLREELIGLMQWI